MSLIHAILLTKCSRFSLLSVMTVRTRIMVRIPYLLYMGYYYLLIYVYLYYSIFIEINEHNTEDFYHFLVNNTLYQVSYRTISICNNTLYLTSI